MTISVREGRIALHFGNGWHAVKWDAAPPDPPPYPYRNGIETLQGELDGRVESTKAVDVVAAPPEPALVLIEIKDFRSDPSDDGGARAMAFAGRWRSLPLEIALKVRDSLAGLQGVIQRNQPADLSGWIRGALHGRFRVAAFLAQDAVRPAEPASKRAIRDSELRKNLQRRLAWLTTDRHAVVVLDPLRDPMPAWLDGLRCTAERLP